ncbi:MAG: hypothetical protein V1659_01430 [Candidatus Woesearchaeota archaeon]
MKKSQTGLEFMILFGFMMIVFLLFFMFVQDRLSETSKEQKDAALKDVSLTIMNEIALARSARNGYSRSFFLPDELNDEPYSVEISEDNLELVVRQGDSEHLTFLDPDVSGDISFGKNVIIKRGGVIVLSSVMILEEKE